VSLNPGTDEQRFFIGHTEDVTSFAVHPTRSIVATGQRDPKGKFATPYTCVWDTATMKQICRVTWHERWVEAVAFSGCGDYLITVGGDDDHTAALWPWRRTATKPLLEFMTTKGALLGIACHPRPVRVCV
jgi:microtubule-associated protein-like 6